MFDAILPELKIPAFPVHITLKLKVIPVTKILSYIFIKIMALSTC